MSDPSDMLPPSEIEAIEATLAGIEGRYVTQKSATELEEIAGKLLRHIHALTAPADGEALADLVAVGLTHNPAIPERDRHRGIATLLHSYGSAKAWADAQTEIARLTAELAEERAEVRRQVTMINALGAEIKGHDGELDTARADGAREEREEIENMIGDDTHSGVAAVAPYLIERLRTRGGR